MQQKPEINYMKWPHADADDMLSLYSHLKGVVVMYEIDSIPVAHFLLVSISISSMVLKLTP